MAGVTRYLAAVRAYKFLDADGCGPFTAFPWKPGVWIETERRQPCRHGVHGCHPADLARWLSAALWEVELEDPVVESHHKVVSSRGRLGRPLTEYPAAVRELAERGAWRARDRALEALTSDGRRADELVAATSLGELAALGGVTDDATFAGRAVAFAADAAHFAQHGLPAQAPFVVACAAGHAAAGPDGDQAAYDAGYNAERDEQSAWLASRLGI